MDFAFEIVDGVSGNGSPYPIMLVKGSSICGQPIIVPYSKRLSILETHIVHLLKHVINNV